MEESKKYLKNKDILPRISFKDGKEHTVQIKQDKLETITDSQGKETEGVKYKVIEDGEVRTIFTSSIALISKLSVVEPDTVVKIKQKKYKDGSGQIKTTYEVVSADGTELQSDSVSDDDIPVINEDESEPPISDEE